jgi:ABC-2 type transport system permease protein
LRLYVEFARRGYRRYAAYPAATIAGVFTNSMFGFMIAYILLALYRDRDEIAGYDASDAVTYAWLAQALIGALSMFGWNELALRIRSGDIATDLARPVDLVATGFAFDLGRALHGVLYRGVPPFVLGAVVFDLTRPPGIGSAAAFLASVVFAVGISFAFRFLYNLPAFWLLHYRGPMLIALFVSLALSGMIIPVRFFPDWLAAIANATPFPSLVQTPIDVFVGETRGIEIATALGVQAAWLAVLLLACRAVLAAGTRRLVVQGG